MNSEKSKKDSEPGARSGASENRSKHTPDIQQSTEKKNSAEEKANAKNEAEIPPQKGQADKHSADSKEKNTEMKQNVEKVKSPENQSEESSSRQSFEKERSWDTLNQFDSGEQVNEHDVRESDKFYSGQPTQGSYAQSAQYNRDLGDQRYGQYQEFGKGARDYPNQNTRRNNDGYWQQDEGYSTYRNRNDVPSDSFGSRSFYRGENNEQNLFAHENNGRNMKGHYSHYENPWISDNEYREGRKMNRNFDSDFQNSGRTHDQERMREGQYNRAYRDFSAYPQNDERGQSRYTQVNNYPRQSGPGYESGLPDEAVYFQSEPSHVPGYAAQSYNSDWEDYQERPSRQFGRNQNQMSQGRSYYNNDTFDRHPGYDDYNYYETEQQQGSPQRWNDRNEPYSRNENRYYSEGQSQFPFQNRESDYYNEQSESRFNQRPNRPARFSRRNYDTW